MSIPVFEKKLWLSSPTMHGEELEYINEAFSTNWVSTVGANIDAVEAEICKIVGVKYAVALTTGTASVHMALKMAGVSEGDIVFCSDLTFAATANPIVYLGAKPVFIDTEYETWNMDPEALERAFIKYPNAKAVCIAHLYGVPAKIDKIKNICEKYGAVLVEDAAEALGASYKGIAAGNWGDSNAISFNGNKIITGSAGGMFLTNSEEDANQVRKWSTQSREPAPWYQHEDIGYNYRMSNIIAGVIRGQILHLEEHIAQKTAIYERYKEGFKDLPVKMNPYDAENSVPNFWLSCILIDDEAMCKQVRGALSASFTSEIDKTCPTEILSALEQHNAEGRPIWKPMHLQPYYNNNDFISIEDDKDFGLDIFNRGLCLPSDNKMTKEQQDIVIDIVKSCF